MKTFLTLYIFVSLIILSSCSQENNSKQEKIIPSDTLAKAVITNSSNGEKIFSRDCVTCHGSDGKKKHNGAKDLSISVLNIDEIVKVISSAQVVGDKLHAPRFPEVLTNDQIKEVGQYIMTLRK